MKSSKNHARRIQCAAVGLIAAFGATAALAAPTTADIMTIIDESGSMDTEHAWIPNMITDLDIGLNDESISNNQFGLVGFGANGQNDGIHDGLDSSIEPPHKHPVGGGDFGTASELGTAAGDLVLSGSEEDGWWGLDFAINNYSYRDGSARNFILITDEDRDDQMSEAGLTSVTKSGLLSSLSGVGGLLNVVVDATFQCGDQTEALGIDAEGTGFIATAGGGFTTCLGASAVSGDGSTIDDYVDLALSSGGAAWDLNQLRLGDTNPDIAQSFTNAFVNIKVGEITQQPPGNGGQVPVTSPLALFGIGLLALAGVRRRIHA